MKTIAYLRVSTPQQDAGSQRLAILEYARKHGLQIDDFVEATARGQASVKHRQLDELFGILNRGDRLVVSYRMPAWVHYLFRLSLVWFAEVMVAGVRHAR